MAPRTCELGDEPPAAMAVGEEEGDQLLVLLRGPWPLLETDLVAARLPAHLSHSRTTHSSVKSEVSALSNAGGGRSGREQQERRRRRRQQPNLEGRRGAGGINRRGPKWKAPRARGGERGRGDPHV